MVRGPGRSVGSGKTRHTRAARRHAPDRRRRPTTWPSPHGEETRAGGQPKAVRSWSDRHRQRATTRSFLGKETDAHQGDNPHSDAGRDDVTCTGMPLPSYSCDAIRGYSRRPDGFPGQRNGSRARDETDWRFQHAGRGGSVRRFDAPNRCRALLFHGTEAVGLTAGSVPNEAPAPAKILAYPSSRITKNLQLSQGFLLPRSRRHFITITC